MTSLDQFIETIKVAGKPIGGEHKGYKIDNTAKGTNMRAIVDLASCHSCDYFLTKGDSIILLEETQLLKRITNIREQYPHLNEDDMDTFVNNRLRERMQLKAYGTMLVLCRLTTKFSLEKYLIQNKKYHFWLVASRIDSEEEKIFFDNLKDSLREKLKDIIGTNLLDDVDVISSETLEKNLAENALTH